MAHLKIGNKRIKIGNNLKFGEMIFKFKTTIELNNTIDFILKDKDTYTYKGTINWGDGNIEYINETPSGSDSLLSHTYSTDGTYKVIINATSWPSLDFGSKTNDTNDTYKKIIEVISWGKYNNLKSIDFLESTSIKKIPNECNAIPISYGTFENAFKSTQIDTEKHYCTPSEESTNSVGKI